MKETEKAYLAGVIDSDGTICIVKSAGTLVLRIRVEKKREFAIHRIQDKFEGTLGSRRGSGFNPDGTFYDWVITGRRAQEFLRQIYPYMEEKKEQAEMALEFPVMGLGHRPDKYQREDREMIRQAMRGLNRK